MAHTCPECGSACYCGGDIDDIFLEENADDCTHWQSQECDYSDDPDYAFIAELEHPGGDCER